MILAKNKPSSFPLNLYAYSLTDVDKVYLTWSSYTADDVNEYILYQDGIALTPPLTTTTTVINSLTPGQIY